MRHLNSETAAPGRPPVASAGIERRAAPENAPVTKTASKSWASTKTGDLAASREVRIVEFRNGEAVIRHPALRDLLDQGWRIQSAVPHLEESEEVKLLVVLER